MKKYILFLLIFITTISASPINEEILKKLDKIEHNQELLKQEMRLRFEGVDKRFEAIDKRFEAIDKRFEMMNESFNKRFEAIDKRFEAIDKRFEMLTNFMMALTGGIFGLIGFMMWDRRTVVDKARRDMENSEVFNKKADKEYVDRLIKAMNELLAKDEKAREVFRKYGLI